MTKQHLNKVWKDNPEHIRRYYDNLDTNEKLCREVEYIIKTKIKKAEIEVAQVSSRAKTLESFCEKIYRKNYNHPFDEISDFAGVRIVYLYSENRQNIEAIIEQEFDIVEKIDKSLTDEDKFGYDALHYLVKIRNNHAGARYDELKNKACEIQVRTILQDAWALVAHHLSYKQESDVPKELRRKLNALSGLFETADDQFQNIRNARRLYQSEVREAISSGYDLPDQEEANIDSLETYLASKFPGRNHNGRDGIAELLQALKSQGYSTLSDINSMIEASIEAVYAQESKYPPSKINDEFDNDEISETQYSTVGLLRTALVFMSEDYLRKLFSNERFEQVQEFRHLIKRKTKGTLSF